MPAWPNIRIAAIAFATLAIALTAAPAAAGDNDWTKVPPKPFEVKSLQIDDLIGKLIVDVKEGGPATIDVTGVEWKVKRLAIWQDGSTLHVRGNGGSNKVWDWRHWFDFNPTRGKDELRNLIVHISVPKGMAITVENMIGSANVGDTYGALKFETVGAADSTIGNVGWASVSLAGSGKVSIGSVSGDLHAETAGSGDIVAGNVGGKTQADIAGSGSVRTGWVGHGIRVEIAGSGDFSAAGVNGPTHVEIAGSGSVRIADGEANPLHIEIMGSGDVSFGGMAVDPDIESMGSGNVTLKAYRGQLHTDGNVHLKTGQ